MSSTITENPLLIGQGLPPFAQITPDHVVPGITQLLTALERDLTELENNVQPTWKDLVEPLEKLQERLTWSWGIVGHLMGVKNSPELRTAHATVQPNIVQFINKLNQSKAIYQAFKQLKNSDEWDNLDSAQQRIINTALRDAELSGVGLEGEDRDRFNAIQLELAELSTKFSNHVLDATKAFSLTLTTPEEIAGLPPSLLSLAAQAARSSGSENATAENGPWKITLDLPSFGPFLKYSQRRDLREQVYRGYISRASSGEWNNFPLIERILELKKQKANILGFSSFAETEFKEQNGSRCGSRRSLIRRITPCQLSSNSTGI